MGRYGVRAQPLKRLQCGRCGDGCCVAARRNACFFAFLPGNDQGIRPCGLRGRQKMDLGGRAAQGGREGAPAGQKKDHLQHQGHGRRRTRKEAARPSRRKNPCLGSVIRLPPQGGVFFSRLMKGFPKALHQAVFCKKPCFIHLYKNIEIPAAITAPASAKTVQISCIPRGKGCPV